MSREPRTKALLLSVCVWLLASVGALAQQQTLGNVVGHINVQRGDSPPERILVTLEIRGAPMDSVYTDSSGTFGFHNLGPNSYYVTVNDDHYEPLRRQVVIDPVQQSPTVYLELTLVPKKKEKPDAAAPSSANGSNRNLVDVHEYLQNFPKPAVKEFEKGIKADAEGKPDDGIKHYLKAVAIAPNFYVAHDNLGSDYLSKSDFANARKEFARVIELNQSDSAAYFNLSNVCMLTGQMADAQQNLNEGLRRQPDSAFGQFLLGSLNMRLQKYPLAEVALLRAIQVDPTMAQARLQLVNLLLQQGRKEAAVAQLHEFVSTLPDSPFTPQAKQVLQKLEGQTKPASVTN
jgi:tetratricopeptide (TPR) repeat protein